LEGPQALCLAELVAADLPVFAEQHGERGVSFGRKDLRSPPRADLEVALAASHLHIACFDVLAALFEDVWFGVEQLAQLGRQLLAENAGPQSIGGQIAPQL